MGNLKKIVRKKGNLPGDTLTVIYRQEGEKDLNTVFQVMKTGSKNVSFVYADSLEGNDINEEIPYSFSLPCHLVSGKREYTQNELNHWVDFKKSDWNWNHILNKLGLL